MTIKTNSTKTTVTRLPDDVPNPQTTKTLWASQPEWDDDDESWDESVKTTVDKTRNKKTKPDGTDVFTLVREYNHRDGTTTFEKKVKLVKKMEDGSLKQQITIVKIDADGQKTKKTKTDLISPNAALKASAMAAQEVKVTNKYNNSTPMKTAPATAPATTTSPTRSTSTTPVVNNKSTTTTANNNKTKTKHDTTNTNRRPLVPASETVPPQVQWEPEHRAWHDWVWGLWYVTALVVFLMCGFTLVAKAQNRWAFVTVDSTTPTTTQTEVRIVSQYFQEDVRQCCANKPEATTMFDIFHNVMTNDLCSMLTVEDATRRRRFLQDTAQEDDDSWFLTSTQPSNTYDDNGDDSKLEPGDGMFDAFSEAPGIPVTLCLVALVCALLWVILLRFFSTPIVFVTEAFKVAFFIYLFVNGIVNGAVGAAVVALVCAVAVVAWDIYTRKQLIFAGKVLSYAASSFQDNMAMFCAFIPILALYALHAYLFVLFYASSFNVVEVQSIQTCYDMTTDYSTMSTRQDCSTACVYVSPSYTTGMIVYISLVYLWSVLLFATMRLSIIATIIGSWHFHPHDKPSIGRAIVNTYTTSLGTLSVASLIMTIADQLNRLFLKEAMWMQCFNPVFWIIMPLYCLFGACCRMLIMMFTKFSVILHVFTGKSWYGSAKGVYKILKRHFKGGFVTEYASTSVLNLGSYVFSIAIYFIAWVWLDQEFHTDTFIDVNDSTLMVVVWLFFALFNIWYPVLGLYLMIALNRFLSQWEILDPAAWVVPFAATFVGCIAMMFFTYLAGIFLDTVDVLFLCFAIDRDNNVDLAQDEFATLVSEGVSTVLETPDLEGVDEERPGIPATVVVTGVEEQPVSMTTTRKYRSHNTEDGALTPSKQTS